MSKKEQDHLSAPCGAFRGEANVGQCQKIVGPLRIGRRVSIGSMGTTGGPTWGK